MSFQRKPILVDETQSKDSRPDFSKPPVFERVSIDEESPFITAWKRPPSRVSVSDLTSDIYSICFRRNDNQANVWAQIQAVKALERHTQKSSGLTGLD